MSIATVYEEFCTTHFPLPTEADVANLELQIGVSLPLNYRRFLLEYNGGYFISSPEHISSPRIIRPADCEGDGDFPSAWLDSMYGIGEDNSEDNSIAQLGESEDIAIFDDNDPPQILPIGNTLKNYIILLVTHPDENGSILLRTFDESFWLADGIEDFFELLVSPE